MAGVRSKSAMSERISLFDAVRAFMGPLAAEGCQVIDEGHPDMPVIISFGPCTVEMTLADLKRLDRAYMQAHDDKIKRSERKYRGGLL